MPLFKCKISCYDTVLTELGLPENIIWLDFAIKPEHIIGVKEMPDGEEGEKSVIYVSSGDSFVTDVEYEEIVKIMETV